MMYTILDNDGYVLYRQEFEEQPENGVVEVSTARFLKPRFDFTTRTFFEGGDPEEVQVDKVARATVIDEHYTQLIFDIQKKHVGKQAFEPGYVVPQIAIDQVNALRAECNQKILDETGLTTYAYRQTNPKLATED